jgi:hypothetical protein
MRERLDKVDVLKFWVTPEIKTIYDSPKGLTNRTEREKVAARVLIDVPPRAYWNEVGEAFA